MSDAGIHIIFDSAQAGQPPTKAEIDVVAIHGLNFQNNADHARGTWTKGDRLWLRDFLPEYLPKPARVMLFGYNSSPALGASAANVDDHARTLLQWLHLERKRDPNRPLVIISHSLGGLVAKSALVEAKLNRKFEHILAATCLLVFFATPHQGGNFASVGDVVAKIVRNSLRKPRSGLLDALKKDSNEATRRYEQARHLFAKCPGINFYEELAYGVARIIVDKKSATLNLPGELETQVGINANHSDICKFESADAPACRLVMGTIADEIETALGLEENPSRLFDERSRLCLADLWVTDPTHDRARIQGAVGGTVQCDPSRLSLRRRSYRNWRERAQGGLLWVIKGDESERTVLLCDFIDELESQTADRFAYFFCQGDDDPRTNNALAVLRSLIYGLIKQQNSLVIHVRAKWDIAGRNLFQDRNSWVALREILTDMLMDIKSRKVFFVIDALDHCTRGLSDLLKVIVQSSSPHVKWIVSSHGTENDDIDKGLQLDPLRTVLGLDIDVTYEYLELQYLEKIHDILTGENGNLEYCLEVLSIVMSAYRPLLLEELEVLAGLPHRLLSSRESIAAVVRGCGPFLSVADGKVDFANRFSRQFLCSSRIRKLMNGRPSSHSAIFRRSLAVLSETLHRNMYDLNDVAFDINNNHTPDTDPLAAIGYACVYWVDHLAQWLSDENFQLVEELQDGGVVDNFLKSKYVYWLEALCFLRHVAAGKAAMKKLKVLLQGKAASSLLHSFVCGALRFLRRHEWLIQRYPLQLYVSALLFSPDSDIVKKLFIDDSPGGITIKPTMDYDWFEKTMTGYPGYDIVFSPDGKYFAMMADENAVGIWDASTGERRHVLAHSKRVRDVIFSSDSRFIISTYRSETMISAAETGDRYISYPESPTALSPNSTLVAWIPRDGEQICLWDATTCFQWYIPSPTSLVTIGFSTDSRHLACAGEDDRFYLFDIENEGQFSFVPGNYDMDTLSHFSPNGRHLALQILGSYGRNRLGLMNLETGQFRSIDLPKHNLKGIFVSPDSEYVAALSEEMISIFSIPTAKRAYTLHSRENFQRAAFSSDSQLLAVACNCMALLVHDRANGWIHKLRVGPYRWLKQKAELHTMAFDQTGRYLTTEAGVIDLGSSPQVVSGGNIDKEPFQEPSYVGLGLHSNGEWIMRGSEKTVLLPRERSGNRNKPWAVSGSTLAFNFIRSKVWVFHLCI